MMLTMATMMSRADLASGGARLVRVVWTRLESNDPAKGQWADREWRHMRKTWGSLLETADPFNNPNVLFHWDYHEIPSSKG